MPGSRSARLTRAGIPRWPLQAYLRVSPALCEHYVAAQRVRHRRRLPFDVLLKIVNAIRSSDLSTRQAVLSCTRGTALRRPYESFIARTLREPGLCEIYLQAKQVRATLLRQALAEDVETSAADAAATGSTAALRAAKRQHNKALHRLDQIEPARLANRQRAINDPRATELIAARRRAANARRLGARK
jgi:hypothetical protein